MTAYTGLCVGGPWAGRRYSHPFGELEVVVLSEVPAFLGDQAELPDKPPVRRTTHYHHEEFSVGREAVRFGFWRHEDMTLAQLLTELAKAYEEKQANA